jgi:hypothetical protein
MSVRLTMIALGGLIAVAALAGLAGMAVGHRMGRGSACLEVALATEGSDGSTLAESVMTRPAATVDYTFWGRDCTLTIAFDDGRERVAGRWRFDMESAQLFAEDDAATRMFPGAGPSPYRRRRSESGPARHDERLFVPAGATAIAVGNGGLEVSYQVAEPYPAARFIESIDRFYASPWTRRDELVLFPGRRSSEFKDGWTEYYDGGSSVFMRPANWQSATGDVASVVIRYRVPEGSSPTIGSDAMVQAVLTMMAR